jgi:HTH-type transcriptional regulator / antitoxin HigA
VGEVRRMLRQPLNIAPNVSVYVNGQEADSEWVLRDGDTLEFIKASGRKGFTSDLASKEPNEHFSIIRQEPTRGIEPLTSDTNAKEPFLAIRTDSEYEESVARLNALVDEIGDNTRDSRYRQIETLSVLIEAYDREHHCLREASAIEVLRFLMEEHGLTQKDLPEIGSQGVVSEVLAGRRRLNVRQMQALAARFGVHPAAFVDTTRNVLSKPKNELRQAIRGLKN